VRVAAFGEHGVVVECGGHHLLDCGLEKFICTDLCIIDYLEGAFVLFVVGNKMEFSSRGGSHGVGMDVTLDMVVKVICGEDTVVF
jgi:hypothetical protein